MSFSHHHHLAKEQKSSLYASFSSVAYRKRNKAYLFLPHDALFLTYSPVGGGHPFFERMMMSRVARNNNNNNNALFVAKREFVSLSVRQFLKNSFPSFYRSSSPPRSKEVFVFVLKEKLTKSVRRSFYLLLRSNNTLFHQTKTEAKNEQTRRG